MSRLAPALLSEDDREWLAAKHEHLVRQMRAITDQRPTTLAEARGLWREHRTLNRQAAGIERSLFADLEARGGRRVHWWTRPKKGKN